MSLSGRRDHGTVVGGGKEENGSCTILQRSEYVPDSETVCSARFKCRRHNAQNERETVSIVLCSIRTEKANPAALTQKVAGRFVNHLSYRCMMTEEHDTRLSANW